MSQSSKTLSRELSVAVPVNYIQEIINCIVELAESGNIRVSDSGLYSVFDVIRNASGKENPRQAFATLAKTHPDTVHRMDSVKFSRKDGKKANAESPATDLAGCIEIVWLLPGDFASKMRILSAKYVAQEIVSQSKEQSNKPIDTGWTLTPDYVEGLLRRSLGRTSLSLETQEIAVLRGVSSTFPQLKPGVDDAIAVLQESTATLDRHVSPKKLGELYAQKHHLPDPVSSQKINAALESAGLQYSESSVNNKTGKTRKVWHITDSGLEYGVVYQDKSQYSSKTVECVRWLPDVIDLIEI